MGQFFRFLIAVFVCLIALALPYRLRLGWFEFIAWTAHLPFVLFGRLARFVMKQTETVNPYGE